VQCSEKPSQSFPNIAHCTPLNVSIMETDHFINNGYGWVCKRCYPEMNAPVSEGLGRARFHTEGEAEDKELALSTPALARWRDASRRTLVCPYCGIEEMLSKA
jgi:hypothetical protein